MKTFPKIAVMFAVVSLANAARAEDAGVVVSAQKDVRVESPGRKAARIGAMQSVAAGSRISVGAGSRAVVVIYASGARWALGAGSVALVSADGLKGVSGAAPTALPALKLQQAKVLRGSRIAFGRAANVAMRGDEKDIELRSLSGGATIDERPTFKWSPVAGATSYKIRLWDDNDKQILEREANVAEVTYPADAPPLKPNVEYLWRVSTVVGDDVWRQEGSFQVLSAEKRAALKAELDALNDGDEKTPDADAADTAAVLQAEIYTKYDLLDSAVGIYEQLVAKNPDSAALHRTLASLLADQLRNTSSKLHVDRATELEAQTSEEKPEEK